MKKLFFITLITLISLSGFAQKPSLNKAYNAFSNGDYLDAKQLIDQCLEDPKLATKANTYLYKGNIYLYLANQEYEKKRENNSYQIQFPDAPLQAFLAFKKAKEIDKNVEGYNMFTPDQAFPSLYGLLFVYGVDVLIANQYAEAISIFEKAAECYEIQTPTYPLYGELYYYYGYALEMTQNPKSKEIYEKAILDSTKNVNVYIRLIEQYKKDQHFDKIEKLFQKAAMISPNDPSIYVAQIDYYFQIKDTVKARKMLEQLPPAVYNNPDLLVNVANSFIVDKNYLKANELLRMAYAMNKDSYVILYNLGVCNYYLSESKFKEFNELELQGDKLNGSKAKTESDHYLNQAQTFFEKIIENDPNDFNVLTTLKSIYGRQQSPKYDEISKRIEELKNK